MIVDTKSILVVEDEPDTLVLMRLILEKEGYTICEATNANEVFQEIQKEPAMVLMDVKLPNMSGVEICQRLKEDSQYRHIPIIMVSALAMEEHIAQGLQAGAEDYVTKPFHRKHLLQLIKQYI